MDWKFVLQDFVAVNSDGPRKCIITTVCKEGVDPLAKEGVVWILQSPGYLCTSWIYTSCLPRKTSQSHHRSIAYQASLHELDQQHLSYLAHQEKDESSSPKRNCGLNSTASPACLGPPSSPPL
ncbi:hypothetical protein E2C01_085614 [Portunus trituberculatus]|uniref:Uncharacterized protein n=1 Tax=Portunus trituberculatus TaxID=210409 RepID=A0A5B7JCF2_PORTR|nr:hypothetical protein [Portunus trituberculatus]